MKRALVCGAGGFIGGHLVKKLKREGYWVRGVDLKYPEFSPSVADEFQLLDLRLASNCFDALYPHPFDEVYQLAADMGGMGFIHSAECAILRNNTLINNNMAFISAERGIPRYFFSSSVCVYPDMENKHSILVETGAYPAYPDNEYGWEKLYAERTALALARHDPDFQVRIARFENCYGPEGTWQGGREKAPAALCRKVAMAQDGGEIEVWGNGTAVRSFVYVDDLIDGIYVLMQSDENRPTNIGNEERITVEKLAKLCIEVSGKNLHIRYVKGPVGVQSRNFSHTRICSLGWQAKVFLKEGIGRTYLWVRAQVEAARTATA